MDTITTFLAQLLRTVLIHYLTVTVHHFILTHFAMDLAFLLLRYRNVSQQQRDSSKNHNKTKLEKLKFEPCLLRCGRVKGVLGVCQGRVRDVSIRHGVLL